ncbi:MAG: CPBP family intramembrane glutamic endopeptidase [Nitrolancea sp.]
MIWPWIHILIAYAMYILFALGSSVAIAKIAGDMRDMSTRNSARVLLLGTVANLLILVGMLLLVVLLEERPISVLGTGMGGADALAAFGGAFAIFFSALGFIGVLRGIGRLETVAFVRPAASRSAAAPLALGLILLLAVALQEEVLNRGYVTLNLRSHGPLTIILISTTLFTAIHFLTNRGGFYQVVSWVIGGLILILSYVLSGSLWVPVTLHFATDAANVLTFNITGQGSAVISSPPVSQGQRAAFRLVYGAVLVGILFAIYGTTFALP